MPIPDYQALKLPALSLLADKQPRPLRELYTTLAASHQVTPTEQAELLPSGKQTRWHNRVNWACYDLYRAGIFSRPKRATYQITELGQKILAENPAHLDRDYLRQFPHFAEWETASAAKRSPSSASPENRPPVVSTSALPANERLEEAYAELQRALQADLLEKVRAMEPGDFEHLVVELISQMGYGGHRIDAARVTGGTGDGGIDGIIDEDRLGLDSIYLQAKHWQNPVGRPEIQAFVGALAGHRAHKGVFITSGTFTQTARDFADSIQQRIILIDGQRLTELMVEFNLGVSEHTHYIVKRIDNDYFEVD